MRNRVQTNLPAHRGRGVSTDFRRQGMGCFVAGGGKKENDVRDEPHHQRFGSEIIHKQFSVESLRPESKFMYSSSRLVTLCLSEVVFPLGDELEWSEVGQRLMWAHAVVGFLPAEQLAVQHGGLIGFGLDLVELLVVGTIRPFHVGIELR